jgi:SAM-dependent methyltransferase
LEKVDFYWDDEGVIPPELSKDTEFVFQRMTDGTLGMVDVQAGEVVLDVGCGRGLNLVSLKEKGGILVGCDASKVMLEKAQGSFRENRMPLLLIGGVSENLPFKDAAFDKVYCKGAIDHFYNPFKALLEMSRVLKADGRVVISVANFESLGCILARTGYRLSSLLFKKERPGSHFWEPPDDHLFKFDRRFLRKALPKELFVETEVGTSLFWGVQLWSRLLDRMPKGLAQALMKGLDRVAFFLPAMSDVIIIGSRKRTTPDRS